jgi:hypothetical protein
MQRLPVLVMGWFALAGAHWLLAILMKQLF